MAGKQESQEWVAKLGIGSHVHLLPTLSQHSLWGIFQRAEVYVSPSVHDGTPNSFLEALACGCFPVVGDIESFREWITPGDNGLLVDAANPRALADAIIQALSQSNMRERARVRNRQLVKERADKKVLTEKIDAFYQRIGGKFEGSRADN